jgi:hypothetical protein
LKGAIAGKTIAEFKLVKFLTSNKDSIIDIKNVKVIIARQGKGHFINKLEYRCTIKISDYLANALLTESA